MDSLPNWGELTLGQRIRHLEVEGYLVLPDLLSALEVAGLKAQTSAWETRHVDYSERQRYRSHVQFEGGAVTALIGHAPTVRFLRELFGPEILLCSYTYARSDPGHPGISLHADGQPYGSAIFGYEGSCPVLVRVLYYLDDLTPEVSPFRVVPRSHLSLHADANPYLRYESHPEEVMVPARAGSAVLIHHRVIHGNYPNRGDRAREMLALGYRPRWAGPVAPVPDWDRNAVAQLPLALQPFFADPNSREGDFHAGNKPAGMPRSAPGINPSRWERT
jgi:hypothetical protein